MHRLIHNPEAKETVLALMEGKKLVEINKFMSRPLSHGKRRSKMLNTRVGICEEFYDEFTITRYYNDVLCHEDIVIYPNA